MAFIKDTLDKIILGRWRFLNLSPLVSENIQSLAIDENGNLGTVESGDTSVSWDDITDKPETFAPTIGTTEDTAKAGNWTPSAEDIPTLPLSKIADLTQGNFLIGGASGNEQRKILPADLGLTSNNTVAVRGSTGNLQGWAMSTASVNSTIVVRTPTGQGRFSPSINNDEAVVQSQFQTGLESKVDKVAGKGLSSEDYTTDEKLKLAGLEDVHYKGWFTSLAALQSAHPSPEEGSHALVDDVSGSLVYIWDVDTATWIAKVGESTEMTPAQVKSYYESNPDTNAFTDARRDKLDSITSIFTSALKTAYDNVVNWIATNGQLLIDHLSNTSNPHNVTAEQLGLGDVDNTSDFDKPISNATQTALNGKQAKLRGTISPAIPAVRQAVASLTAVASGSYFTINNFTYGYDIYSLKSGDSYVIPAWASHVRVTATVNINNLNVDSVLEGRITRNGGIVARSTTRGSGSASFPATSLDTGIIPVASGDSFAVQVLHNNGDSRNLSPNLTFINIELFESI